MEAATIQTLPVGITCVELRRINKGALLGFATLRIEAWHLTIHNCGWFRSTKGEWISMPSQRYETRDGKVKYQPLVEFSDKMAAERFQAAALRAVQSAEARPRRD